MSEITFRDPVSRKLDSWTQIAALYPPKRSMAEYLEYSAYIGWTVRDLCRVDNLPESEKNTMQKALGKPRSAPDFGADAENPPTTVGKSGFFRTPSSITILDVLGATAATIGILSFARSMSRNSR